MQSSLTINGLPGLYEGLTPTSPHYLGGQLDCTRTEDVLCNYFYDNRSAGWLFAVQADGKHRFAFVARNMFRVASTSRYQVTVDLHPPKTAILSAIDGAGAPLTSGGSTTSGQLGITFDGSDTYSGVERFECSLNGAEPAACSSPFVLSDTGPGGYQFRCALSTSRETEIPPRLLFNGRSRQTNRASRVSPARALAREVRLPC